MKKFRWIFFLALALALTLAAVFFGFVPAPASAGDSGNEYVVWVLRWRCLLCGKEFYTFDPDDIAGKSKGEYKVGNYQQSNWFIFGSGGSRPVPKCGKAVDGGHVFEETDDVTTSPANIERLKNEILVLKDGRSIKTKVYRWECALCNKTAVSFAGDDMDLAGEVGVSKEPGLFVMQNGGSADRCSYKMLGGLEWKFHMPEDASEANITSMSLAKEIGKIWFSK